MPPSALTRVRKICLSFPEAHEVEAWGQPSFRVRNKLFAMYSKAGHHTTGREAVWLKCTPINQGFMVKLKPKHYFMPPYVGMAGWVGAYLDGRVNWKELGDILRDAYDLTASKLPKTRTSGSQRTRPASQLKR